MIASLYVHIKISGPAGGTCLVGVARVPSPLEKPSPSAKHDSLTQDFSQPNRSNPRERPFMPLRESELDRSHEEESQVHQWAEHHYPPMPIDPSLGKDSLLDPSR